MPPSPAFRFSPRELNHKRGRSLESGLHLKQKDDDLALFSDMQSREKDNFLLHSSENIEDSFSTQLKCFSDYKLGITIPVRGESSDLLDGDGDKNDYDWLLTPPDTPLFPSLDDEPPLVNPVHRGRPRSQPIPISRTAMAEKNQRSNRSSASPQRLSPHHLSPSPRSGGSSFQTRGRASSAPNGSPNLLLRPTTPTRRPSTPPNKPSTPAPRSSTPTLRRMSTGSSGTLSSTKRSGTSPGKTSRGNSASPKLRAWQTTLPGFSSDPPPNLRTSLSDRPASHVRGASPASRSGRGRQSMSPTASRSGSSNSHDRDRFSTQSRGSIASSGDDDIDSLQSLPVGTGERPTIRKSNSFSTKTASSVKKHSKTFSPSSAPKRSFDYTLRQMDQRKSPQNMFRPLLSSVPSTTFYVGKSNSTYRSMISRNSSVTTSSNASSELGASIAPDIEGSDHEQDDLTSEWGKAPQVDGQDEIFVFDKLDEVKGEKGQQSLDNCGKHTCSSSQHEPLINENFSSTHPVEIAGTTTESSHVRDDPSHVNHGEVVYCSICGSKFYLTGSVEGDIHFCPNCAEKDSLPAFKGQDTNIHEKALETIEDVAVIELPKSSCNSLIDQSKRNVELVSGLKMNTLEEFEHYVMGRQVEELDKVETNIPNSNMVNHQLRHLTSHPSLKIDGSEGAGISLLLKRSVSSKWPVVQGRAFTASNIPCDDPSYVRDSLSSVRSFNGPGTSSASTSVDWSSHRQSDIRFQRQLSNKKVDMESSREDLNTILLRTRSSSSGVSDNASDAPVKARNMSDDHVVDSAVDLANGALEEERLVRRGDSGAMDSVGMDDIDLSFVGKPMLEEDKLDLSDNGRLVTSTSDLSTNAQSIQFVKTSGADIVNCVDYCTMEDAEGDFSTITKGVSDMGFAIPEVGVFVIDKDSSPTANVHVVEVSGASTPDCMSSVAVEKEESLTSTSSSQNEDLASPDSKSMAEEAQKPSDSAVIDKDATVSASESYIADNGQGISEESTVTVEGPKGQKSRSLTLEEATDTILFCRSIIQDLAYEAATIAMEREDPVPLQALEGSRPTVTILAAHSPKMEPRSRTSKRTPKGQKHRHRRLDSNSKNPSTKDENEKMGENLPDNSAAPARLDSAKPPKLESKCNCTVM